MNTDDFQRIRVRAREKRNKLIEAATAEYESTLAKIAELELTLNGKVLKQTRKISAAIDQVLPQDRPFTTRDIMYGLEALDPARVWRAESINCYMTYLREHGRVVRVKRAKTGTPAVYIRKGVTPPPDHFRDMRLIDVIKTVLTRPMTQTEVAVAILEAGYETPMSRPALRQAVGDSMRGAGFKFVRPKWIRT